MESIRLEKGRAFSEFVQACGSLTSPLRVSEGANCGVLIRAGRRLGLSVLNQVASFKLHRG